MKKHLKKFIALFATIALLFGLSACDWEDTDGQSKSRRETEKQSEKATNQQIQAVPYPGGQLKDSLERRNLKERLIRQSDPKRIGYVYILSFGNFIGYYTIKGKVSSTQSQMNPSDDVSGDMCGSGCSEHVVTESAGDDGSYGPDENGIFFFTTEGVMVQVSTDYIYSDSPIGVGNIPELNKK